MKNLFLLFILSVFTLLAFPTEKPKAIKKTIYCKVEMTNNKVISTTCPKTK